MPRVGRIAGLRCWGCVACLLVSGAAVAQDVHPSDEWPALPAFQTEVEPELLPVPVFQVPVFDPDPAEPPPLDLRAEPEQVALRSGGRVFVREVRVDGNTALPPEPIAATASRYEGRELSLADIEALRDALTQGYADAGYLTSGAVVPQQSLSDGVLEVEIVEGRLADIQVRCDGRLRENTLRRRLELAGTNPVNVKDLRQRIRGLQRDPRIHALEAELMPNGRRGESSLRVQVMESRRWYLSLGGDNHANPWLGEWRGRLSAGYDDLLGVGDGLWADYAGGEGLQDIAAGYAVPITPGETRLELALRRTWSEVVEPPLDDLDDSETETYSIGLAQPVLRGEHSGLELFVRGAYRRSEAFPFSSTFPVPEDGDSTFALLRAGADWAYHSATQVLALRAQLTRGFDALGATNRDTGDAPDAEFFAGLVQIQWARLLPLLDMQLHVRAAGQLSDEPLLGLEQISLGGHASVRGYREDQAVRDDGLLGSIELRIPVALPIYIYEFRPELVLVPFFDAGRGWDRSRGALPEADDETLLAPGIGARLRLLPQLLIELDWGLALSDVDSHGDDSLQGEGLHLGASWTF